MRTKSSSKKTLTDQAAELVEQVSPHVEAARERIVNDYLPVAQTVLADARDAARDVAQDARAAAQEAAANAEKSTRKSRKKAAKKARAKAGKMVAAAGAAAPVAAPLATKVADKVDPKPKRKKRVVLLLGLVGIGTVVFKRFRGGSSTSAPAYSPPRPAPTPRPSSATPTTPTTPAAPVGQHVASDAATDAETTDQGGAFLDEAIADASEEPHRVTTPDQPIETVDVADVPEPKKS